MVFKGFKIIILFLFGIISFKIDAQIIQGKLSVKEIDFQENETLLMGNFFFHPQEEVIIYDILFPEKVSIFFYKNKLLVFENDSLVFETNKFSVETSVFHNLFYKTDLKDILKNNGLNLVDATIDKNNDDIFVFDGSEGKIKILAKYSRNNLVSVVTVKNKSIIEKVIINQYIQLDGYRFPSEFFKLSFQNNSESKQWVTISDYKQILKSERLDLLYKLL